MPLEDVLSPGDQVLVALENENQIYIIGVLNQKVVNKKRPVKFEIENGAFAKIEGSKGKANIQIFSNQKDLIFEYSPSSGKAKVISNSSSICVEAPGGDLSLNCKGNLNLGAEQVNISGHSALNLTTAGLENFKGSSIGIKNNQLKISSPDIRTTAELGHFNIKETRYTGKNLLSKIGQLKIVADKMETTANSVVDKIKDIFKTVENLYQLKAKRKRMVVETTYHVKAEDITFKSEEDFKVKGNQIHLG
ncbi:MAG: DUF3540 domain-containing protein [Desulfobacteraceae bacterium]|nr:DUF3540 domain-containing protein [Desulfobacteraceae bacterium]